MRLSASHPFWLHSALILGLVLVLPAHVVAQNQPVPATKGPVTRGSTPENPVRVSSLIPTDPLMTPAEGSSPMGSQARVMLKLVVDPAGKVQRSTIMSGPAKLRGLATQAAKEWTFRPYILDGTPVFAEFIIVMDFHP